MNPKIASRGVAWIGLLAASTIAVAGCGDAFTLSGGTGGAPGTSASVGATTTTSTTTTSSTTTSTTSTTSTTTSTSNSSSASSSASSTSTGPGGCATSLNCGSKEFCLKDTCGAGVMGICSPFAGAHTVLDPVCGCDGITYWNGAYLSGSARSAQSLGPCNANDQPPAKPCTVGSCGLSAHCVFAKTDCANVSATGTCWTLPDQCDNTVADEIGCDGITDGNCANVCDMIVNNKPFHVTTPACVP